MANEAPDCKEFLVKCGIVEQGTYGEVAIVYRKGEPGRLYFRKRVRLPLKQKIGQDGTVKLLSPNSEKTLPIEQQFIKYDEYLHWLFGMRESQCLCELSRGGHPNFVQVFHVLPQVKPSGARYLHFIMEYCEGGSLTEAIKEAGQQNFDETTQVFFFKKLSQNFYFCYFWGEFFRFFHGSNNCQKLFNIYTRKGLFIEI